MNNYFSIDVRNWDLSYSELIEWSKESGIDVWAINAQGGNGAKIYAFKEEEHLTAFKLRFEKYLPRVMRYRF